MQRDKPAMIRLTDSATISLCLRKMGFYAHCGSVGEGILLREVGTGQTVSCMVPAGYAGRGGSSGS